MEKRKTRSMVECDNCKALICWGKINWAKYDEYWPKGRKRLCPDCYKKYIADIWGKEYTCEICGKHYLMEESENIDICPECIAEYDDGIWRDLVGGDYWDWNGFDEWG